MTHCPTFAATRDRGFTLLELLLASALTTLLMVGVLGLVSQIGLPAEEPSDTLSRDAAYRGFADTLRLDLEHAASIDASEPNRIVLLGNGSLDAEARRRTHRPVRIVYEISEVGDRRWLIREQRRLDVLTNRNVQRDLVAAGIDAFELASVPMPSGPLGGAGDESEPSDDTTPVDTTEPTHSSGMQPIEGHAWRLTIVRGENAQVAEPVWQQWVSVRGGVR